MTDADTDTASDALTDRERAIAELREVREHARYKVFGKGRIRDAEKEQVRIKWCRLIVQSANAERRLLNDRELEELAAELAELRERLDVPADDGAASTELLAGGGPG